MPGHAIGNAKTGGLSHQNAPKILHYIFAFRLDNEKTVRDEAAENWPSLFATSGNWWREITFELVKGQRFELVKPLKNPLDRRGGVGITPTSSRSYCSSPSSSFSVDAVEAGAIIPANKIDNNLFATVNSGLLRGKHANF